MDSLLRGAWRNATHGATHSTLQVATGCCRAVGNAKTRVVAACRNAIKTNNIHALFKIIQTGAEK